MYATLPSPLGSKSLRNSSAYSSDHLSPIVISCSLNYSQSINSSFSFVNNLKAYVNYSSLSFSLIFFETKTKTASMFIPSLSLYISLSSLYNSSNSSSGNI